MNKHVHIICLTIPYPVIHGGLVDLYYKLIALHDEGVKIHLHCFAQNPRPVKELEQYCVSVAYYERKKGWRGLSFSVPYIVNSRKSNLLRKALMMDNYPIIFEGIHSSYLLNDPIIASRKTILRLHNIEHEYYRNLYRHSDSLFKRLYYWVESGLLKKYETHIARKPSLILTVSRGDKVRYEKQFHVNNTEFIPVFTGHKQVNVVPGIGCFCLYHGNLSIIENEKAVLWLIDYVFTTLNIPLIVAGRNPSAALAEKISRQQDLSLVANPSADEMHDLIRKAQCHVLPSFNTTGVKLKVIDALYTGRHCVVNRAAVDGSGLERLCHVADSAEAFRNIVTALFQEPVSDTDIHYRASVLGDLFDTQKNAESIIRMLW